MKLLKNIIAEKLYSPSKTTTIIGRGEKGIYALVNGLIDIYPPLNIWSKILDNFIQYNVSEEGITREQLLDLVLPFPQVQIEDSDKKKEKKHNIKII